LRLCIVWLDTSCPTNGTEIQYMRSTAAQHHERT
jgi:hypothetical protein